MRTIVITGCAGLLGSHLSRHLISSGYKVIGIDDLSGGYIDYLPDAPTEQFEFWPINLVDGHKSMKNAFSDKNIEACFHFAAYASEGLSPFIRRYNYQNNIVASANVINECINNDIKLIFTSSMGVYGGQTPPFKEKMLPQPIDPYAVAKYAVEMDLKIANEQHDLKYTIVRPHNIVGIYQNIWDKYRNVAGIFIRRVLNNEPMLIYGDGEQTRAFSDVKYYMEPFEKMIDNWSGWTFNLGADKTYTLNELADTVQRVAWKNGYYGAEKKNVEPRHEVKYAHCDHSLAKNPKILNFSDDTNLEELISEMFQWAMAQPKREQRVMPYEVEKGIYDYWK